LPRKRKKRGFSYDEKKDKGSANISQEVNYAGVVLLKKWVSE